MLWKYDWKGLKIYTPDIWSWLTWVFSLVWIDLLLKYNALWIKYIPKATMIASLLHSQMVHLAVSSQGRWKLSRMKTAQCCKRYVTLLDLYQGNFHHYSLLACCTMHYKTTSEKLLNYVHSAEPFGDDFIEQSNNFFPAIIFIYFLN